MLAIGASAAVHSPCFSRPRLPRALKPNGSRKNAVKKLEQRTIRGMLTAAELKCRRRAPASGSNNVRQSNLVPAADAGPIAKGIASRQPSHTGSQVTLDHLASAAETSFTASSLPHSAGPAMVAISQPDGSTSNVVGMPSARPTTLSSWNTLALGSA